MAAVTPLVVIRPPHEPHPMLREFGSAKMPLRPSKLSYAVTCPMSSFLSMFDGDRPSGAAADTGNLVHSAAAAYHRAGNDREAGIAALAAARDAFPAGDPEKAGAIFRKYADDPRNQTAVCTFVEEKVKLTLAAHPTDPTGEPVVVAGTLDQVRRDEDGVQRVYDIKTGYALDAEETILKYMIQQAAYTLAAQQTLDPAVQPGYCIYTPGYEKPRGRRFLDLKLTRDVCILLLSAVVIQVAAVRRGEPVFNPGDACKWCPQKSFAKCSAKWFNVFSN